MKIKVTQKAWYKKSLLQEGTVIEYKGDEVPCWGTLASGEESGTKKGKADDNINVPTPPQTPDDNQDDEQTPDNDEQPDENVYPNNDQCQPDTEEQLQAELDKLIDIAVANEVWVDVAPETSVPEQISLFKEALKDKGIELH